MARIFYPIVLVVVNAAWIGCKVALWYCDLDAFFFFVVRVVVLFPNFSEFLHLLAWRENLI